MLLETCTVLVTESEPVQARCLDQILCGLGYTVLGPVGSGAEASDLLHRQRPNLALLDLQLPNHGILLIAEALTTFEVPFAVLVIDSEDGLLEHFLLRDAPRLSKPYHVSDVHRCVRMLYLADLGVQLALIERHIVAGRERLTQQVRLVERLAADGQDTGLAKASLHKTCRLLRLMRTYRSSLLGQFAALESSGLPSGI